MRNTARALAFIATLLPAIAAAQVYLPPGTGLPPQSVIGNALPVTGAAVAVSFAQIRASMNVPALKTCASSNWFSSLTSGGVLGCTQPAVTDIAGFGAGVATFLGAPSSANLSAALTDKTGSGSAVFATAPALVNANLGTPSALILTNATGLPASTGISGLGTGVVAALGVNVGTAGAPVLFNGAGGTPSSLIGTNVTALNATQLTTGTIPAARTNGHQNGTATNDNAAAGEVGEHVSSAIGSGSAVSLAGAGTVVNVTSISLTAGDWDISILGYFVPAATTNVAYASAGLSTTSGALDATEGRLGQAAPNGVPVVTFSVAVPPYRLSLSSTTTVFFVARSGFTVSTNAVYGIIRARRVR